MRPSDRESANSCAFLLKQPALLLRHRTLPQGSLLFHACEVALDVAEPLLGFRAEWLQTREQFLNLWRRGGVWQLANLPLKAVDPSLQGRGPRVDELKLLDQRVVQSDRRVRRQSERPGLEGIQRGQQAVLLLQERRSLRLDVLSKLINLRQVDNACIEIIFQHGQGTNLQNERILGIADLLQLLQQTDETAHGALSTAGKSRSASATPSGAADASKAKACGGTDTSQTARAGPAKAGESRTAQETTPTLQAVYAQFANRYPGEEPLAIALKLRRFASNPRSTMVNRSKATTCPALRSNG